MRWFNWVGFGMLASCIFLGEWVYFYVWERFNILVVMGAAAYLVVALGLSLWTRPSRE
jgi:hypothetical protein